MGSERGGGADQKKKKNHWPLWDDMEELSRAMELLKMDTGVYVTG